VLIINYIELMLEGQKYIEKHLDEKLSVNDIAGVFGYSEYHFSRLFTEYIGMSVMEYVKRRRLIQAAEDIIHGMKIIDAALKFSYDSHSGFSKAFKKEFGYSPSLLCAIQMQVDELEGGNPMSKIFIRRMEEHGNKDILFHILLECIKNNKSTCNVSNIYKAYELSRKAYEGIQRYSGDEYITHPLNVAIILCELGAGENTIIAGLMCDILKKTDIDLKEIEECLSTDIAAIVKGVSDFIDDYAMDQEEIVLIKLAERFHNMRTLKYMDENMWKSKAKETIEIYMPIARRVGNQALMDEMNKLVIDYV
jgi:AraC-like DNA-binding protein